MIINSIRREQVVRNTILYIGFLTLMAMLVFLAVCPLCLAYRPLTTEDAGVAGKGVAQLEMSWDYLK